MANQIIIDIGAAANDGTGDPLRTAFNYVNNNFSNVWNTGLPTSNVQFLDNKILTVNTNANLVLAPNGIGKVASNVDIVPNTANVFSLGGTTRRWNTVYTQYLDVSNYISGTLGNVTVAVANLHVTGGSNGYVLQTDGAGNLTWTAQTGGSGNGTPGGANTQVQYNNAGSFGGSAAFTFDRTSNVLTVSGNISAGNLAVTSVTTSGTVYGNSATFYGDQYSDGALYVGTPAGTVLGSDVVIQITANAGGYSQTNFQNISNAITASGDYIITADNGNDTTKFIDLGMTSSGWDGSETNVLAGLVANQGYLYVQDGNLTLGVRNGSTSYAWNFDTTGLLTVPGNIIPAGNNTQSLGSATRQWKDLWVSNNTIYINSVPLSVTAGNILTVNGADVVTTNSDGQANIGNLQVDSSIILLAPGATETQIEISPDGESWAYLQIPNDATGNVANVRMHNDAGNIEIAAGDTSRGGDVYYWYFNNTGILTVPGDITSADSFAIASGDDISISGGDKVPGSASSEGGDVTIFGGTGRPDSGVSVGSGGDVRINAGNGGDGTLSEAGVGGYAEVQGGSGGAANVVNNIQAGEGGYVIIQGGQGGDNQGNIALSGVGGNVNIYGGSGSFDDGNSTISGAPGHVNLYGGNWGFITPSGNIYLNTYDGTNVKTLTYDNVGNVTMAPGGGLNFVGSNPGIVQSPDEDFKIRVQDADNDGFALIQQVDDGSGNVLGSTELQRDLFTIGFAGGSAPQFRFNEAGQTEIPGNIRATEYVDTSLYSVSNDDGAGTVELKVISYAADTLGSNVRVSQSNATISTNNAQYTWKFDNTGNLTVPGILTGVGTGEIQAITGSRKIVGSPGTDYAYAAESAGHTAFGNVAWTASSSQVHSARVTFAVQTNGTAFNWEQFDVAVCKLDSANAVVSVSNRIRQNSAIAYTEVSGYVNSGVIEIWLNPADGQTSAFINYDAVEFNIMVD